MKYDNILSKWLFLSYFLSVWVASSVFGQQVEGQVTDQAGEALPGVNIVVYGTTIGTTTDIEGNYQIGVPSLQETLIFSYIGFESQEIPIDGREEIHVVLNP